MEDIKEAYNKLWFVDPKENTYRVVKVEPGLKITIRDFVLENLQKEQYIKDNFKLNIKRLNRWWYSVYFDKKDKCDYEHCSFPECHHVCGYNGMEDKE